MQVPPSDSLQHIINSNSTEFGAKCVDELFQLNLPPHSTLYQSDLCGNPSNTHCTIDSNVENESNDQIIPGDHPTQHIISWITKACSKTIYNTKYLLDFVWFVILLHINYSICLSCTLTNKLFSPQH